MCLKLYIGLVESVSTYNVENTVRIYESLGDHCHLEEVTCQYECVRPMTLRALPVGQKEQEKKELKRAFVIL